VSITKGERAELRSIIKTRFKVLRADVEARRAELVAELEQRITARYADEDKAWADAMYLIDEAAREANRKANDILRGLNLEALDLNGKEYAIITARTIIQPVGERHNLRRSGESRINAQVKSAHLELDRQEADLLTRLLVGALESDEARAFVDKIPTVGVLVPADRLLAIVSTGEEVSRDA
jgi:predicted phage gp36 major capsid-like protein